MQKNVTNQKHVLYDSRAGLCWTQPHIITRTKRTFNTLRLRPPNGINLIMFRDSNVTFSAKIRKKLKNFLRNKPFNPSK